MEELLNAAWVDILLDTMLANVALVICSNVADTCCWISSSCVECDCDCDCDCDCLVVAMTC